MFKKLLCFREDIMEELLPGVGEFADILNNFDIIISDEDLKLLLKECDTSVMQAIRRFATSKSSTIYRKRTLNELCGVDDFRRRTDGTKRR